MKDIVLAALAGYVLAALALGVAKEPSVEAGVAFAVERVLPSLGVYTSGDTDRLLKRMGQRIDEANACFSLPHCSNLERLATWASHRSGSPVAAHPIAAPFLSVSRALTSLR